MITGLQQELAVANLHHERVEWMHSHCSACASRISFAVLWDTMELRDIVCLPRAWDANISVLHGSQQGSMAAARREGLKEPLTAKMHRNNGYNKHRT
eukprot:1446220-Amphidinium_carterae.1